MARRYARDNRGRFASTGTGATARGGRLKTASGNKRAAQTKGIAGGKPAGTVGKPKGAKPAASKTAGGRWTPTTNSKGQVVGMRDRTKPAPSPAAVAQAARSQRANRNLNAAMAREGDGPNSKASRSASVAKRAGDIYKGKVDPKQKTKARLTKTSDPEALRKRTKKIKDNTLKPAAAKPAAKPATKKPAGRISPEKVSRVTQRVNDVTANASSKSGVKRLNSTEVGVRAKAFLTRKAGGMSGMVGKSYAEQQAVVAAGMKNPTRYSTQKANRNKPRAYNELGQAKIRQKNQAAANIERNNPRNAAAGDTARGIRARNQRLTDIAAANAPAAKQLKTRDMGPQDPDKARSRNNRLQTTNRRVKYLSDDKDTLKYQAAVAARGKALAARPAGTGSKVVFRGKNKAANRQNVRANDLTTRVRFDLQRARPGAFSATAGGGRVGIRRTDTGNRQPSLLGGPAKKLYSTKRVAIKRARGGR